MAGARPQLPSPRVAERQISYRQLFPQLRSVSKAGVGKTEGPLCPVPDPPYASPGVGESRRLRRGVGAGGSRAAAGQSGSPRRTASQGMRRVASPAGPQPPRGLWRGRSVLAERAEAALPGGRPSAPPPPPGSPPPGRRRAAGPLCRPRRAAAPRAAPGAAVALRKARRRAAAPARSPPPSPNPAPGGGRRPRRYPLRGRARPTHAFPPTHPATAAAVGPHQSPPGPGGARPAAAAAAELAGAVAEEEASRGWPWGGAAVPVGMRRDRGGEKRHGRRRGVKFHGGNPKPRPRARGGDGRGRRRDGGSGSGISPFPARVTPAASPRHSRPAQKKKKINKGKRKKTAKTKKKKPKPKTNPNPARKDSHASTQHPRYRLGGPRPAGGAGTGGPLLPVRSCPPAGPASPPAGG